MKKILFVLLFVALVFAACSPAPAEPTQDLETIVQATFQALTLQAPTQEPATQTGGISGQLSFPSQGIPPLLVVAFDVNSQSYYYVITIENQSAYQIDNLPAGNYYIVTYTQDGTLSAGYSQAVVCGLLAECTDHSLIAVPVTSGQVTNNINPQDWYAPPNSFPANPLP